MRGKRGKYSLAHYEYAIDLIENEGNNEGLTLWNRGGALGQLEPRTGHEYPEDQQLVHQWFIGGIPNLDPRLLEAGKADRFVGRWLIALSFHAPYFRGEFLLDHIEPWRKGWKSLKSELSALKWLRRGAPHFDLVAYWLTIALAKVKGEAPRDAKDHAEWRKRSEAVGVHYKELLSGFARLLPTSEEEYDTLKQSREDVERQHGEARSKFGLSSTPKRPWLAIRRVALYLWLRLITRHNWSNLDASRALVGFLRARKCGYATVPPDSMFRKKRPTAPPKTCHIWAPSERKGNRFESTAANFDRQMYDELAFVFQRLHEDKKSE